MTSRNGRIVVARQSDIDHARATGADRVPIVAASQPFTINDVLAEFHSLTPEIEKLKQAAGHGDHDGWSLGGEPYDARCSCGTLVTDLVASLPSVTGTPGEVPPPSR